MKQFDHETDAIFHTERVAALMDMEEKCSSEKNCKALPPLNHLQIRVKQYNFFEIIT